MLITIRFEKKKLVSQSNHKTPKKENKKIMKSKANKQQKKSKLKKKHMFVHGWKVRQEDKEEVVDEEEKRLVSELAMIHSK